MTGSRCSGCARAIRGKRRVSCSTCDKKFHIKCWKSMSNCKYATIEKTTRWSCNTCAENNLSTREPERDAITIPNASELNELYIDNNDTEIDEDTEFYPLSNVQDMYFESSDVDTISTEISNTKAKFFMTMCVNVWSLNQDHFTKLDALISSLPIKPKVLGINETWLNSNDDGPHNNLGGYSFISNCRKVMKGGG